MVISDGMSWFHKIYVKIEIEVEDAGQVELICLLIANEIAMAERKAITIRSDCLSALNVIEGGYSELLQHPGWVEKMGGLKHRAHQCSSRETQGLGDMGLGRHGDLRCG